MFVMQRQRARTLVCTCMSSVDLVCVPSLNLSHTKGNWVQSVGRELTLQNSRSLFAVVLEHHARSTCVCHPSPRENVVNQSTCPSRWRLDQSGSCFVQGSRECGLLGSQLFSGQVSRCESTAASSRATRLAVVPKTQNRFLGALPHSNSKRTLLLEGL